MFEDGAEVYPSDRESRLPSKATPDVEEASAVEANLRPELGADHSSSLRAWPAEIRNTSNVGAMPC